MTDGYARQMRHKFISSVHYSIYQGSPFFVSYEEPFFMFSYFPLTEWGEENLYLPNYFNGYSVVVKSNYVI